MGENALEALAGMVKTYGFGSVFDGLRGLSETDFDKRIEDSGWSRPATTNPENPTE